MILDHRKYAKSSQPEIREVGDSGFILVIGFGEGIQFSPWAASIASDVVGNSMRRFGVAVPVSSSGLSSQPVKLDVDRAAGLAREGVRKTWRS